MHYRILPKTKYLFNFKDILTVDGALRFCKISILSLIVVYVGVVFYNITVHERQWDFRTYYYASAFDSQHGNPYRFEELSDFSHGFVTEPYVYPPLTLHIWKIFHIFDYQISYFLYFILKLLAVALLIFLWQKYFVTNPGYNILMLLFCLFAFKEAMQVDLYSGNISAFEQIAIWSGIIFFIRKKPWAFSVLILVASLVKLANISLLLLLLLDHDRKSWSALLSTVTALVGIHAISFLVSPGLAHGFVNSLLALEEYGSTNQASFVVMKHFADWLSSLATTEISHLGILLYLLYLVFIIGVSYFHSRGYNFKNNRLNFVIGGLFLYALTMPRFKDYSFILLIVPAIYIIEKAISNNYLKILISALVLVTFFKYQGFLTIFLLYVIYLRYLVITKKQSAAPSSNPGMLFSALLEKKSLDNLLESL